MAVVKREHKSLQVEKDRSEEDPWMNQVFRLNELRNAFEGKQFARSAMRS